MSLPGLEVSGLRKEMPGFSLRAQFTVASQERVALSGPSGIGKTTLLRLIAGLESPDAGSFRLDGRELAGVAPRSREIGFIFQDHALFPALSVAENIAFGLRVRGVGAAERRAEAERWLSRIGLEGRGDSRIDELSGGEKSRVGFARAVIWKPKLLLCDEPFSALDPALRAQLRSELVEIHRLWPVPLLLVTHDEADVAAVATARLEIVECEEGIREVRRLER